MAHELDVIQSGVHAGKKAMFSVGETPWHDPQASTVIADAPTLEEALELGGLNFEVVKRPTFIQCATPDGDSYYKATKTAFTTWRTDRELELGSVGPDYAPIQNLTAFRVLGPLLDSGVLTLETGGTLRNGADVWLLGAFNIAKFGPMVQEVFGDEVIPFATITNNHTGRRNAQVALTPIRIVCANTLGAAESLMKEGQSSIGVRHTGDAEGRLVEAAETLFHGIVERYEIVAQHYKALKQTILDRQQFEKLVLDTVVPDPRKDKRWNPEARMASAVIERFERKRSAIETAWHKGKGHVGDNSAWEAYNGVVEVIDHDKDLFPTRSGIYRTQALLDGTLRDLKRDTLNKLAGLALKA